MTTNDHALGRCTAVAFNAQAFYYRSASAGDRGVIAQIFADDCYDLDAHQAHSLALRAWETRQADPLLVIDAGANIGASAVWFAAQVPRAYVIAIEPEADNHELLVCNTRYCNRIKPVLGAVAAERGYGQLIDPGRGDWGFRIEPGGTGGVLLYTIPELISMAPTARPYVLKIDIEGGEAELFRRTQDPGAWMRRFPLLIIELHDWMLPGRAVSRNLLHALTKGDFDVRLYGENLWCFNNDLLRI